MSAPPPETPDEFVAEANVSSRSGISVVWLIPLVALAIGAWLVYKAYTEKGPTITISFQEANGVVAGKTLVRYRDAEIGKVAARSISDDLTTARVSIYPSDSRFTPDYFITGEIVMFDGTPGGEVTLDVHWVVTAAGDNGTVSTKRSAIAEPVGGEDYTALVDAHARAVNQLSAAIEAEIRRIQAGN